MNGSRRSGPDRGSPRTGAVGYFYDELARPFLAVTVTVVAAVSWSAGRVPFPNVAVALFVVAAVATVAATVLHLPLLRLREPLAVIVTAVAMLAAAAQMPLAHAVPGAAVLPYLAAVAAGANIGSRPVAIGVVLVGAVEASALTAWVAASAHDPSLGTWWQAATVCLPVYIGFSQRERVEALHSARRAADEAQRAARSEAREATLRERNRIAQEMHDVLGHSLSAISLQLNLAEAMIEEDRARDAAAAVTRAREIAVGGIDETRRAVHALAEDDEPVTAALQRLARRTLCALDLRGEPAVLEPRTTHAVLRTAQEALTNATRHAPGAARSLRVVLDEHEVTVTIHNGSAVDGSGDGSAGGGSDGGGAGLPGMRARAAELGGTLHAGPAEDGGWTVTLELPR